MHLGDMTFGQALLAFMVKGLHGGFSSFLHLWPLLGVAGLGFKSYFQFGLEASYGTDLAATRRFGYITYRPDMGIGRIVDPTLNNSVSRTGIYQGPQRPGFKLRTRLDYSGLGMLWDLLFGTSTYGSQGAVTTGASPYAHTFLELPLLNSHSMEVVAGDVAAGNADNWLGVKCQGAEVNINNGDQVPTVDWDFIAKSVSQAAVTGSLTAPTANPVLFSDAVLASGNIDDGTSDSGSVGRIRSMKVSIKNPLEAEPYLGSLTPDEAQRGDFIEVIVNYKKVLLSGTLLAAANAFTVGSPKAAFGPSTSKRITFDAGTAYVKSYTHPVDKYGIVLQEVEWEAIKDTGNASAMKLTVENTVATLATGG